VDPENVIEAAVENDLSEDKTGIDSKPVYTELAENIEPRYACLENVCSHRVTSMTVALTRLRYEKRYLGFDPHNMVDLKHFTEAVGRTTIERLDKERNKSTVRTIRNKMCKTCVAMATRDWPDKPPRCS